MPVKAGMLEDKVFWSCLCVLMNMMRIVKENGIFKTNLNVLKQLVVYATS